MSLEREGRILLTWIHQVLFSKTVFYMCLVNNISLEAVKAITGEKSLPALTTGVMRRQVFGWVMKWLSESQSQRKRAEVRGLMIWMGLWLILAQAKQRNRTPASKKKNLSKFHKILGVLNEMSLIYLFLAVPRTSLFSLETASVLSHSNLKIEMSLLGCIAVMAATSFGLFNCAVNIKLWDMLFNPLIYWTAKADHQGHWFVGHLLK